MEQKNKYEPIEHYGIIGDLHTVALVSRTGSIDLMSFTRFDSPTVFAAMLDADKGGRFSIHPQFDHVVSKQLYLPDTAVLVTRFLADEGIAELTDYMPAMEQEYNCAIVRKVQTIRGKITYNMNCSPRFNYARTQHAATGRGNEISFASADGIHCARLVSTVPISIIDNDGHATFTLAEGELACFIFESDENKSQRSDNVARYVDTTYKNTIAFWQAWVDKSDYAGRWRENVHRSAITLKLLTSQKFGSVVAAPTFSLPEEIGGERNWDYRYTWTRDAAFTMYAFLQLGFKDEAVAFMNWIKEQCMNKALQLMYAVDGGTDLTETTLDHLEGYKNSKPVRIGNAAHTQFQLDIYGELIDTIYLFNKHVEPITYEFWQEIERLVENVIEKWNQPDHGIWEIRGETKEFLNSKLMSWVALDRGVKIAIDRSFPGSLDKWRRVRDEIFLYIQDNFWSETKQAYVQHKGSDALDASVLLMPLMRFVSPLESRWRSTLQAVGRELKLDVLIYRYRNDAEHIDGLKGDEGTFTMCSFWYIECLSKSGFIEEAREQFEKMLGYANHLGLFAEQLGKRGEHLGNFPQAFTHLALISAAMELNKSLDDPHAR